MKASNSIIMVAGLIALVLSAPAFGASSAYKENIYNPGKLKPIDSQLKVKVGEPAPDFGAGAREGR